MVEVVREDVDGHVRHDLDQIAIGIPGGLNPGQRLVGHFPALHNQVPHELQTGVTLGFIFVVWLWSQALYEIRILCPFCMIVWAAMIPLFVWVTVRNVVHGVIPVPSGVARIVGDSGWIITALLYVAVIATIFFAFIQVFVGTSGF